MNSEFVEKQHHSYATSETLCVACKSSINSNAIICPICSSYQGKSRWKNTIKFWVPMTGFLTVVLSLITYLWTAIPETFFADKISILAFDSTRITVSNEGYGKIYLDHVFIKSDNPLIDIAMANPLSEILDVEDIARIKIKPYPAKSIGTTLEVVANCSEKEWHEYLNRSKDKKDGEYRPAFYLKNGSTMKHLIVETNGIRTFDATAVLEFYSIRMRRFITKEFALTGVVMRNK